MARHKGVPNKRSTTLLSELYRLGINLPDRIIQLINSDRKKEDGGLTDRDRLFAYLELLQYVYPKRKAIEISGSDEKPPVQITYDTQFGDATSQADVTSV